ncbi:hypothetical protein RhiirA1_483715, partial [Rhizophagus irregularis]
MFFTRANLGKIAQQNVTFQQIPSPICGTGSSNESLKIANDVEYGNEDYQTIVSSNNQLGFELMEEAERDDNGNIFISPTSLVMALSMVYNGADGVTKEEMAN